MAKLIKRKISRNTAVKPKYFIHKTAIVENDVKIGEGSKIWHFAQVRQGSKIGKNCIIGKSVFIDVASEIGDNVKIQNHAIVYHKAIISDGVFIGPNVCFTNDKIPRAVNPDGTPKKPTDWQISTIKISQGASIGGHCVILPGVTIGEFALAGSGSVITKDIPPFGLVYGNPAKVKDFVCRCGKKLEKKIAGNEKELIFRCSCGQKISILKKDYRQKDGFIKKKIWLR